MGLRPEHHDSVTLRVEAEPAPQAESADDDLADAEMLTLDLSVQHGDELKNIAAQYGVSIWKIIASNDIPDPDSLRVGQVLKIPDE